AMTSTAILASYGRSNAADDSGLLDEFADGVIAENPVHANFLAASRVALSDENRGELIGYLNYCLGRGLTMAYLVDCYNTIVIDTQMEQLYFRKHNRYRCSSFKEVADRVYFDTDYMSKYMYGLAITSFLWPNHTAMYAFFVGTFPTGARGTYLEIGPGHGYYFRQAGILGNFDRMVGVDISAASIALTKDIVERLGVKSHAKIELIESDFLKMADDELGCSCIVMGEVLEHVEDPAMFLRAIARRSRPDTHVFITTCVNAPAIDHISLFRTPGEVEDLIQANGLHIVEALGVPYAGKTLQECEAQRLAVNVAYTLRKA
ncbi:MAG TPA: class I SAM-dependent methyltransferase, partial [Acetobacteraceae bacterium]|nr:class I SAM-dependent methyltransferase [Acetobacteraceae bacterium]